MNNKTDKNKALVIGGFGIGLKTIIDLLMKEQHPIIFGRLTPIQEKIITGITDMSPKDISGEWLPIDIEDENGIASPSQIAKLNASGFRVMAEEASSFTKDDIDLLLDSSHVVHPLFCNTCGCAKYMNNCNCINKE